jgi:hypothetical protein
VGQLDKRKNLADRSLASFDFGGQRASPFRIPIQVDRNRYSGVAGGRKEPFVASVEHRVREPNIGAQQMIGPGKRSEVERLKCERAVIRMAAQEMTLTRVVNQSHRRSGREIGDAAQVAIDSSPRQDLLQSTAKFVIADLTDERRWSPQCRRDSSAIGAAAANCFQNGVNRGLPVLEDMPAGRQRSGFDIAIDVPDHAQLRTTQG